MKLLNCGNGVQLRSWHVEDPKPLGYCRVYYIDSGDVWYDDEYGTRKLKQHWLYFFPSVKTYQIHHNPDTPITCLWWHIDLFPTVVRDLVSIPAPPVGSLGCLLEAIRQYFLEENGKTPVFLSMVETMVGLCREQGFLPQPEGRVPEILDFMNEHFRQEISVEQISRHFHYTPEHFIRLFQRELNLTPYQYLTQCRMREAERLLLADVPVKEVAPQVGYGDTKVFAYRFKQFFGIAPSRYKKFYHPVA